MIESLLAQILIHPDEVVDLKLNQWDLLISQARRSNMLARLACILRDNDLLALIPEKPRKHLLSEQTRARRFATLLGWEIQCIAQALEELSVKLVLLKGAAYYAAGNNTAEGRVFSDIDILVPENQLLNVERALAKGGWISTSFDAYEQQYYRKWMHEIPPLRNLKRQTSLDVHHNILPKTCRFYPDALLLLSNSVNTGDQQTWVLSPEDRVLHSAAHLFHEGEFDNGFRDLSDLHFLLMEFSVEKGFWSRLLQRSTALRQQIPLYYALRYCQKIFFTPVPESIKKKVDHCLTNRIKKPMMDFLFMRALLPNHHSCSDHWTGFAKWILYIRSHWLRMPLFLLIPHLLRKSWMRLTGKTVH